MLKFRWQRGSLDDSMQTVVDFESFDDLVNILRSNGFLRDCQASDIAVKQYTYDERIGWDTHIVTYNGSAVGFTDGPVEINYLKENI